MSETENEALVTRIAEEIWTAGNLDGVDEVMAADAVYHHPSLPGGEGGREDWRRAIAMYRTAAPDSRVVFEDLISSGDLVVGRWRATGTQTGPLPGLPPTGRRIDIGGITIYRIADGRIVEAWEQLDLLGMWRQLGVFAPPGPA